MKYFKMFENQAAEDAWKESEDYIQPSITSDRENIDTSWNYKEKFRAHFDLSGLEGDVKLTNCGNIFDSLKVNGEEKVSEKVEVTREEVKSGKFGTKTYLDFTVTPNVDFTYNTDDQSWTVLNENIWLKDYPSADFRVYFASDIDLSAYSLACIMDGTSIGMSHALMGTVSISSLKCVDESERIYKLPPCDPDSESFLMTLSYNKMYGCSVTFCCVNKSTMDFSTVRIQESKIEGEMQTMSYEITSNDFSAYTGETNGAMVNGNLYLSNDEKLVTKQPNKLLIRHNSNIANVGVLFYYGMPSQNLQEVMFGTCDDLIELGFLSYIDDYTYEATSQINALWLQDPDGFLSFTYIDYDKYDSSTSAFTDTSGIITTTVEETSEIFEEYPIYEVTQENNLEDVLFNSVFDFDVNNGCGVVVLATSPSYMTFSGACFTQNDIIDNGNGFAVSSNVNNLAITMLDSYENVNIYISDQIPVLTGGFSGWGYEETIMYINMFITSAIFSKTTTTGGASKELSIDASVGNVTMLGEISPYFDYIPSEGFKETPITDVIIPSPISGINKGAFAECEKMNSAYLPKTIKKLGDEAFCNSIHKSTCVNVDRVEEMGDGVFEKQYDSTITARYNVSSTTEATKLLAYLDEDEYFDIECVDYMLIDGVRFDPMYEYTFNREGEHEVVFYLKNGEVNLNYLFTMCPITYCEFNLFGAKPTSMWGMFMYVLNEGFVVNFNVIDTSHVIDMAYVFQFCTVGEIKGLEKFNTSKVTNMSQMFGHCPSLTTLDLSNFDTSNVTNMSDMFSNCIGLTSLDLSNFDTSNVTDMNDMFNYCSGLTSLDLSNFDTSKVTDMNGMFSSCYGLTSLDLSNFNTSNVTNMGSMFSGCSGLTSLDLSNFDTSNVTNMGSMFSGCYGLTSLDLSNFDTSNVTDMSYMFARCSGLTSLDLSNFDTSNVTDMSYMFRDCSGLTSLILTSYISYEFVYRLSSVFSGVSSSLTIYHASACDTTWYCGQKVSTELQSMTFVPALNPNLELTYITSTISPTSTTTSYKLINDWGKVETMSINGSAITPTSAYTFSEVGDYTIEYGIIKETTKSCSNMFYGCYGLTSLDLSNFDTSKVTDMGTMFYDCRGLTSLDLSNFDTSKVTDMSYMFRDCSGLTSLDLSNFDTSNVTNMGSMFRTCGGLTSLDLSNFDTSKVTDMSYMFTSCYGLTSLDLSNFDTSKVTDMDAMFYYCYALTSVTFGSQADVSKVTSYGSMFSSIYTTGTLYYPLAYADSWNNLLVTYQSSTYFPSTWTAVAV